MSDLHVVFGAGQVGNALAHELAKQEVAVRIVSQHQPSMLTAGIDWQSADATNPESAADAAKGASVIYQCLNAPYAHWPKRFPPLQQGVISAALRAGALLVSFENLYGYGPVLGKAMTEDLPLAATTVKGKTRAAMTRDLLAASAAGHLQISIGRASDLFGPGVSESVLGARVFEKALDGKPVDFLGNPDLHHTYSYVTDVAAGLATLGLDQRSIGQIWHLPGPETVTTNALLRLVEHEIGIPIHVRHIPGVVVGALELVSPTMHAMAEMAYEFEESFVLDTSKFENTFAKHVTPLNEAVAKTVAWYRRQAR